VTTKEALHRVVDELTEDELRVLEAFAAFLRSRRAAERQQASPEVVDELRKLLGARAIAHPKGAAGPWLAYFDDRPEPEVVDPVLQALYNAPVDDELQTDEEVAGIEEAKAHPGTVGWETYVGERRRRR
jgi:hypothetical protein